MKHLAILIVTLLLSSPIIAQDFQGKATYKSHRKMEIQLDSTQMNSDMHKQMMAMMQKQFEKTYILTFNKEESLYKEDAQLEAPQPSGMRIEIISSGESGELYKNIKEDSYTDQNDMFGKVFLIEDKLKPIDWKLGSETKNIGEYTCYKATVIKKRPIREVSFGGDKEDEKEKKENQEETMEEYAVTAWYTPQIPVNNGPGNYHGLPGLILEVNDGSQTLICSKIVLNPKDKISISKPIKGKKVNQEAFDEIMEKKMKEMQERYHHNREDGNNVEITIRG